MSTPEGRLCEAVEFLLDSRWKEPEGFHEARQALESAAGYMGQIEIDSRYTSERKKNVKERYRATLEGFIPFLGKLRRSVTNMYIGEEEGYPVAETRLFVGCTEVLCFEEWLSALLIEPHSIPVAKDLLKLWKKKKGKRGGKR